ncbi:hypothetical protein SVAN01_03031 [Stagonosporopsis vannaccii]|nr:hypothetical protein SVAN01_03031 [Stagonosporopsis vannaccii]
MLERPASDRAALDRCSFAQDGWSIAAAGGQPGWRARSGQQACFIWLCQGRALALCRCRQSAGRGQAEGMQSAGRAQAECKRSAERRAERSAARAVVRPQTRVEQRRAAQGSAAGAARIAALWDAVARVGRGACVTALRAWQRLEDSTAPRRPNQLRPVVAKASGQHQAPRPPSSPPSTESLLPTPTPAVLHRAVPPSLALSQTLPLLSLLTAPRSSRDRARAPHDLACPARRRSSQRCPHPHPCCRRAAPDSGLACAVPCPRPGQRSELAAQRLSHQLSRPHPPTPLLLPLACACHPLSASVCRRLPRCPNPPAHHRCSLQPSLPAHSSQARSHTSAPAPTFVFHLRALVSYQPGPPALSRRRIASLPQAGPVTTTAPLHPSPLPLRARGSCPPSARAPVILTALRHSPVCPRAPAPSPFVRACRLLALGITTFRSCFTPRPHPSLHSTLPPRDPKPDTSGLPPSTHCIGLRRPS